MASRHHEVPELSETQIVNIQEQYRLAVHLGTHGLVNTEFTFCLPTDKEYDAAAEVVESMHVDDVLFLESRGHVATRFTANSVPSLPRIEHLREERRISAWHYAKYLAQRKGCMVLPADLTKEEDREYGYLDLASLNIRRESKAARTVIDFALDHPRQISANSPGQPTLHLVFGRGHRSGFRRAFRRTGLGSSVEFDMMPHSSLLGHLSQAVALRRKKD